MRRFVISSVLLAVASVANASTSFTWTFSGANLDLGNTSIFSNNGVSITASGFTSNGITGHLYGKNLGGDEVGLGLVADPTGQDEIYYSSGAVDFIQLDLANVLAQHISNLQIAMNSDTGGESWRIYNTASGGTLVGATTLLNGSNEGVLNSISPTLRYLDVIVTGPSPYGNVLLYQLTGTSSVPEPATFGMAGAALLVAGLIRARKKRSTTV